MDVQNDIDMEIDMAVGMGDNLAVGDECKNNCNCGNIHGCRQGHAHVGTPTSTHERRHAYGTELAMVVGMDVDTHVEIAWRWPWM